MELAHMTGHPSRAARVRVDILWAGTARSDRRGPAAWDDQPDQHLHNSAQESADAQPRILVVEDEGIVALDLCNVLRKLGYAVTGTAASGEEAIRQALETRPDVVLMDIWLQGVIDGIEAAQRIRAEVNIPVVFVTAHGDAETLDRASAASPFGYITKPYTPFELRASIELALQTEDSGRASGLN
jgi:CheY-like chemotaxis protein